MAPPATLQLAAAHLESQAERMSTSLLRVAAAAGPGVWRGPAALHFADGVTLHGRQVNMVAEELRQVAAQLRRRAAAAGPPPSGPSGARATGWVRPRSWAA